MNIASLDQILDKVKESLKQTRRDVETFLRIFPDLTTDDVERVNFTTISVLPATLSTKLNLCYNCNMKILFREDLNPNFKNLGSLSKNLMDDITQALKMEKNTGWIISIHVDWSN